MADNPSSYNSGNIYLKLAIINEASYNYYAMAGRHTWAQYSVHWTNIVKSVKESGVDNQELLATWLLLSR